MVGVAQLVEPRIVIPVVVGSSPIVHPILRRLPYLRGPFLCLRFSGGKVTNKMWRALLRCGTHESPAITVCCQYNTVGDR